MQAPRQRNTQAEKEEIKAGRVPEDWARTPAKLRHKDRHARWTVKFTKAKPRLGGTMPAVDLAIPAFGYRNHTAIDRRFGLIRTWLATDAAAHEGSRLREGGACQCPPPAQQAGGASVRALCQRGVSPRRTLSRRA